MVVVMMAAQGDRVGLVCGFWEVWGFGWWIAFVTGLFIFVF